MSRCEWDPERNEAAADVEGCPAEAVLSVGSVKNWHLCESCAALPAFKRFRRRVRLHGATKPLRVWMVFDPDGDACPGSISRDSEWSIRNFLYGFAKSGTKSHQWDYYKAKGYAVRKVVVRAEEWDE